MVIKDIDDKQRNFKLLIEEQFFDDYKYKISSCFAPIMGVNDKSLSISSYDESSIDEYKTIYGLSLYDGKIKSYINTENRNMSTTSSKFTDNPLDLYDEIIGKFINLMESDKCEFSLNTKKVFEEFKDYKKKIGSVK